MELCTRPAPVNRWAGMGLGRSPGVWPEWGARDMADFMGPLVVADSSNTN